MKAGKKSAHTKSIMKLEETVHIDRWEVTIYQRAPAFPQEVVERVCRGDNVVPPLHTFPPGTFNASSWNVKKLESAVITHMSDVSSLTQRNEGTRTNLILDFCFLGVF